MRISVVGGSTVSEKHDEQAQELGRLLAADGHEVVCGGRTGVMEAVCRGARENGGHTIGILPGEDRSAANPHVQTPIATGMGNARNALVVLNGDAVIAVDGGPGTLSEIAFAVVYGRPVAALESPRVDGIPGIEYVETPQQALDAVLNPGERE